MSSCPLVTMQLRAGGQQSCPAVANWFARVEVRFLSECTTASDPPAEMADVSDVTSVTRDGYRVLARPREAGLRC